MTTFLIKYTDYYEAKREGWPLVGSPVEINELHDLNELMSRMGNNSVILCPADDPYQSVWWADYHGSYDSEDLESYHAVQKLPDNWREMRWIEIYNGRRE